MAWLVWECGELRRQTRPAPSREFIAVDGFWEDPRAFLDGPVEEPRDCCGDPGDCAGCERG